MFRNNVNAARVLVMGMLCAVLVVLTAAAPAAFAKTERPEDPNAPFTTEAKFAALYDYNTKTFLYEKGGDTKMGPSSMSKLMTAYMVFDALKKGKIKMDDTFVVSKTAWKMGGSRMFVHVGDAVRVEDLIQGMIIQSGNDACVTLAEGLAGTEEDFVKDMNVMAKKIGLNDSHFMNSSGWPHPEHRMTPKDLIRLAVRLYEDFPEYYHFYSQNEYTYNKITQRNRNKLLYRDLGVDGLKTGHTNDNGYGITVSGEKNGRRLFAVVNGLKTVRKRLAEAERLVRHGYRDFESKQLFEAGATLKQVPVAGGVVPQVALITKNPIHTLLPKRISQTDRPVMTIRYPSVIAAPVDPTKPVAEVRIMYKGNLQHTEQLYPAVAVEQSSYLKRKWDTLLLRVKALVG